MTDHPPIPMCRGAALCLALALGLGGLAGAAQAADPPGVLRALPIPPSAQITAVRYRCAEAEPFTVTYINGAPGSLALVPIKGERRIMAETLSADGARYVSGRYEWWTRGAEGTLTDRMQQGSARTCLADRP